MAMTPYGQSPLVISILGTTPQERGLETQQFKAKFDEGLKGFVEWFNLTHKTEFEAVQTDIATHKADNAAHKYRIASLGDIDADTYDWLPGTYSAANTVLNMPEASKYWTVVCTRASSGSTDRILIAYSMTNKGRFYFRMQQGSTWSTWLRIITSDFILTGAGAPEGAVVASIGTLYERTDVGELYVKKTGTGNTGWGKVTTA